MIDEGRWFLPFMSKNHRWEENPSQWRSFQHKELKLCYISSWNAPPAPLLRKDLPLGRNRMLSQVFCKSCSFHTDWDIWKLKHLKQCFCAKHINFKQKFNSRWLHSWHQQPQAMSTDKKATCSFINLSALEFSHWIRLLGSFGGPRDSVVTCITQHPMCTLDPFDRIPRKKSIHALSTLLMTNSKPLSWEAETSSTARNDA